MNLPFTSSPSPHEYTSPDKKPPAIMQRIVTRDSSNKAEDAECIAIVDGCALMEDCKTPEQEGGGREVLYDRFSTRPMNEPPLLKPRRSSLHQEYRSWNAPLEEPSSSAFCSARNAPMFPDSPSLSQRSHVVTSAPWFTHTASEGAAQSPCHVPSRSTTSLSRRVLLSFQDCHIVRLPPRLSRSDGYLHDITWRLQMAASSSSSSLPATSSSTHCRKKSRIQSDSQEPDDMPLLTPVEGYTIPNAPYATFFSHCEGVEYHEDREGHRRKDVLYWDSSTDSAGSSRVATPLPLLDMEDDSEASSNEGRSSLASNDHMIMSSTSGTLANTTSTARLLPVKAPKLKMRTNHPVLLQCPSFASLQALHSPGNTA
jgi:hypothetical protein